jgi:uncharacterized protein YacL
MVLPAMVIAMLANKLIVTPILIWIFNQVWIIDSLAGVTHFIVKLINRENANSINYTIDSYVEESFSSLLSTILGLIAGLIVIPTINKKIPLLCLSAFWLVVTIISTYVFASLASELEVPLKMEADRNYYAATSFIIAGQIIGTYLVWWGYSLYDFKNPFSNLS